MTELGAKLTTRTQMAAGTAKLVSLDLQPMAPLRHTTTLQADLTTPCTIPLVLTHLDNKKADLVICDGAPDVTGVHDLDAYLHHQLLMAAFTLTLAILAKGGTAVYKVFLSPLDPKGERLREGMKVFFRAEEDQGEWFEEYDDENENPRAGQDGMGRRGGVWVRKPRSSRKGSGGALYLLLTSSPHLAHETWSHIKFSADQLQRPFWSVAIMTLRRCRYPSSSLIMLYKLYQTRRPELLI